MTLEEGIQLAKSGNVEHALSVGEYYWNKKDPVEAYDYYVIAANQGSSYGIMTAMYCSSILANSDMLIKELHYAIEHWQESVHWASLVLADKGDEPYTQENKQHAFEYHEGGIYNAALTYYTLDKYQEAINTLSSSFDNSQPKIKLLTGVCKFHTAQTVTDYQAAFDGMLAVKDPTIQDDEKRQSTLITEAGFMLSILYREGLAGRTPSDMQKAIEILTDVSKRLKNENSKQFIATEIGKYRKKLFGGYTYTG